MARTFPYSRPLWSVVPPVARCAATMISATASKPPPAAGPRRPPAGPRRRQRLAARAQGGRRHDSDALRAPRPENSPGPFFVDHTCIDCDTCRWMAPATFASVGDMSAVVRQPQSAAERQAAMQALLSCPT